MAADIYRPAAVTQLEVLGKQLDMPVHSEGTKVAPPEICRNALKHAREAAYGVVILDTAGRLHIDDDMMAEIGSRSRQVTQPREMLLVADAMTGQDAVRVADEFHKRVALTGLILTKVDGDARGGAAISIRSVTGVPIKFLGVGEKTNALEPFQPDRLASRILGMGDVLTLIEKAEATFDQEQAQKLAQKFLEAKFDLEDFLGQLQQVKKMGPLSQVLDMIPGMSRAKLDVAPEVADGQLQAHRGDHQFDDAGRAASPGSPRRQPQAAHRARLGHDGAGSESTAGPVPPDAADDEADVGQQRAGTAVHVPLMNSRFDCRLQIRDAVQNLQSTICNLKEELQNSGTNSTSPDRLQAAAELPNGRGRRGSPA